MTPQSPSFSILSRPWLPLLDKVLTSLMGVALVYCTYLVFLVVPNERVMGPVQRIFYFHVGSAIACYCSFGVVLIAGLAYLATRDVRADVIAHAAGEVGFIFCSIVMVTGMIWGHSAWNTWFRWEPRLITFLILWLIFLSFNILRSFGDPEKIAVHSAILGIIGAVTVPLVVYSIKLLPESMQLHPVVVENRGLRDPSFETAMFTCMATLVALQGLLIWFRTRVGLVTLRRGYHGN